MFARVVTFTGARNIDAGTSFLRDMVVPAMRDQKGFRGLSASADRQHEVLSVLTIWDTESERDASWTAMAGTRGEGLHIIGGSMTSDRYEVMLQDVGATPPGPGSALMLMTASMDPARVDEHLAFFRGNVLPEITAAPGFQAVRLLMNRVTGDGMTGTVWTGEEAMRSAANAAQARRETAAARGVRLGEPRYREILISDMG